MRCAARSQNLGEFFVDLAVHLHGGPVSNLDHDFFDFRLELAQGLREPSPEPSRR